MTSHDPRLDMGRAALVAQLDEATAKISELTGKLSEAYVTIAALTVVARFEPIMLPLYPP
jgi:hypothetical protein